MVQIDVCWSVCAHRGRLLLTKKKACHLSLQPGGIDCVRGESLTSNLVAVFYSLHFQAGEGVLQQPRCRGYRSGSALKEARFIFQMSKKKKKVYNKNDK